jgi:hypothetical protein
VTKRCQLGVYGVDASSQLPGPPSPHPHPRGLLWYCTNLTEIKGLLALPVTCGPCCHTLTSTASRFSFLTPRDTKYLAHLHACVHSSHHHPRCQQNLWPDGSLPQLMTNCLEMTVLSKGKACSGLALTDSNILQASAVLAVVCCCYDSCASVYPHASLGVDVSCSQQCRRVCNATHVKPAAPQPHTTTLMDPMSLPAHQHPHTPPANWLWLHCVNA